MVEKQRKKKKSKKSKEKQPEYKKEKDPYEFDYYKMLESFSKELWAYPGNMKVLKTEEHRRGLHTLLGG